MMTNSGAAVVHVGPLGSEGRAILSKFYERCGLEHVGAGRVPVGERIPFDSLEGLVDNILDRSELIHIVVNHGSDLQGLIVRYTPHATHTATGEVIGRLADAGLAPGGLVVASASAKDLASRMGATAADALRLCRSWPS